MQRARAKQRWLAAIRLNIETERKLSNKWKLKTRRVPEQKKKCEIIMKFASRS